MKPNFFWFFIIKFKIPGKKLADYKIFLIFIKNLILLS